MRRTNEAGLNLIKRWEGFRFFAYRDAVGIWTIGYGHTSAAGPPTVRPGMRITLDEGEAILERDLRKYERAVERAIGSARVTDDQFSAMVSLCYNIGPGAFKQSSIVKHVRAGDMKSAAEAFHLYRMAGGKVLEGLVRRRADEAELFLKGAGSSQAGRSKNWGKGAGGVLVGTGGAAVAVQQGVPVEVVVLVAALVLGVAGFIIWKRKRKNV